MEKFCPPFTVERASDPLGLNYVRDSRGQSAAVFREYSDALRAQGILTDAYEHITKLERELLSRPDAVILEGFAVPIRTPVREMVNNHAGPFAAQRYAIEITIGQEVYTFESTVCTVTPKERVVEASLYTNRAGDSLIVPTRVEDAEGKQRYAN